MKSAYCFLTILLSGLLHFNAQAQGLVLYPADNYGKANKSFEESALNKAQLEMLMSKSAMFEAVSELDEANPYRRLARSVAMLDIVVEDRFQVRYNSTCTATRIARSLIITNYHCVPGREYKALKVQARFGFLDPLAEPGSLFEVDVTPVESNAELDYAILRLTSEPNESDHPVIPLKRHTVRDGESLILIHHPMGQAQRLTRYRCQAARPAFMDGQLVHHCDTLGGSSGSALLTLEGFAFAGLHFGGLPDPERPRNIAKPADDLFRASATLRGLEAPPSATVLPSALSNATSVTTGTDANALFAEAKARLFRLDYAGAEEAFQSFIDQYGSDPLAAEAYFWLGETLHQRQAYAESGSAFITIIRSYPDDPRAPDALVRLARSLRMLGETERGCTALDTLSRRYPYASKAVRDLAAVERNRAGCKG
jgi:tol-pal system protein YbgF